MMTQNITKMLTEKQSDHLNIQMYRDVQHIILVYSALHTSHSVRDSSSRSIWLETTGVHRSASGSNFKRGVDRFFNFALYSSITDVFTTTHMLKLNKFLDCLLPK